MKFPRTPRRATDNFLQEPASSRIAAIAIISATIIVVVAGAVLMRLLDTTRVLGRVIASVVMLTGIGFITVVTASVTSAFVDAAQQRAVQAAIPSSPRPPRWKPT
jgi:hypothetical protein